MEVAKEMPDKMNELLLWKLDQLATQYIIPLKTTTHLIISELYRMFIFFKIQTVIERILRDDTSCKPGK